MRPVYPSSSATSATRFGRTDCGPARTAVSACLAGSPRFRPPDCSIERRCSGTAAAYRHGRLAPIATPPWQRHGIGLRVRPRSSVPIPHSSNQASLHQASNRPQPTVHFHRWAGGSPSFVNYAVRPNRPRSASAAVSDGTEGASFVASQLRENAEDHSRSGRRHRVMSSAPVWRRRCGLRCRLSGRA